MPISKKKKLRLTETELKRREMQEVRRQAKKRRRRIYYTIVAGTIGLLVILSFLIPELLRTSRPATQEAVPGQEVEMMEYMPIAEGSEHEPYKTTPPTSGPYYDSPAPWGIYETELPDERMVRNLYLTGVAINYNLTDAAQIAKLREFVKRQPDYPCYLILQPYARIAEGTVAITAWGRLDVMTGVDEERLQEFVNWFKGNDKRGLEKPACTPSGG